MRGVFWWVDRWRNSAAYVDMTAEEQALFRNLNDEVWLREDHVIPESSLARASGFPDLWPRLGERVLKFMKKVDGGWTIDDSLQVIRESEFRAERQRRYRNSKRNADRNADRNGRGNEAGNERGNDAQSLDPELDLELEQDQSQKVKPSASPVSPPSPDPSGLFGPDGPDGETRQEPQKPKTDHNGQAEALVAAFHATLPMLPKVRVPLAGGIRKAAVAALRRESLATWQERFTRVATCPFLVGEKTDWKANLVWILGPENSAKIDAGQYDRHEAPVENFSDYNRRSLEQAKRIRLPWETEDVAPWDGEALPNKNEKTPLRIAATPTTDEEAATAAKVNGLVRGLLNGKHV